MVYVGKTVKRLREALGLTPDELMAMTGVSRIVLAHVEASEIYPPDDFTKRFQDLFGIDIFAASWCMHGNVDALPEGARGPAQRISEAWNQKIEEAIVRYRERYL